MPSQSSFQSVIAPFLTYLRDEKGCSKRKLKAYQTDLAQFITYLLDERPDVTPQNLDNKVIKSYKEHLAILGMDEISIIHKSSAPLMLLHFINYEKSPFKETIGSLLIYLHDEKGYSQSKIKAYQTDLAQFMTYLLTERPDVTPQTLTYQNINSYEENLTGLGLDEISVIRKTSAVRMLFRYLRPTDSPFKETILNFLTYLSNEKGHSAQSIRAYQSDLEQFTDYLSEERPNVTPQSLDHLVVRAYMAKLAAQGLTARSVARKVTALRRLYRYLVKEEIINSNPLDLVDIPKERRSLPKPLSREVIEELLKMPKKALGEINQ